MAESTIQPEEAKQAAEPGEVNASQPTPQPESAAPQAPVESTGPVIWSPGFIVCFWLTITLGLSAECFLTRGWQEGWYNGSLTLLFHEGVLLILWGVLAWKARSNWIRLGAFFGCLWAIFSSTLLIVTYQPYDQASFTGTIVTHLNATGNMSLLGMYICFATERVQPSRWDAWFFGVSLLVGCAIALIAYFITPADIRSVRNIENAIIATSQVLCILVWWLRPVCWKTQPGPTFLFGLSPAILLVLAIPGVTNGPTNLLFLQISDLCLILGGLRILQAQRVSV